MLFHDDNPVPPKLSNKRLTMQSQEQIPPTKRDTTKEVTFIDTEDLTPAEEQQRLQPVPYVHPTSTNPGKGGYAGRGDMSWRGGYGGRWNNDGRRLVIKDPVPLPYPWRNEVDNLLQDMRINIIREIKPVITTIITIQISEIAIAMVTQIKTVITSDIVAEATEILNLSPVELDEEPEKITQSPMMNNDESQSTPMEEDTDPWKIKVPTATKETLTTNKITRARDLQPQKHRELVGTPKKILKEGQKQIKKKYEYKHYDW